jgi:copper transport protein
MHGDKMMAIAVLEPGRVGMNKARLYVLAGDGGPLTPKEVTLSYAPTDGGLEPRTLPARRGEKFWSVDNIFLASPGSWTITVKALITDFDEVSVSEKLDVTR